MAITTDNLFVDGFRGTVGGNMTFRRTKSGKVIVSKKRKASELPPNAAQLVTIEKFKKGLRYAKSVMKDAGSKVLYETGAGPDQNAFNRALKDACLAPKVKSINRDNYLGGVGNTLSIDAEDDFSVTGVKVVILGADGNVLEQDAAVLQDTGEWLYTTTQANATLTGTKITATATDLPGNTGSLEITL